MSTAVRYAHAAPCTRVHAGCVREVCGRFVWALLCLGVARVRSRSWRALTSVIVLSRFLRRFATPAFSTVFEREFRNNCVYVRALSLQFRTHTPAHALVLVSYIEGVCTKNMALRVRRCARSPNAPWKRPHMPRPAARDPTVGMHPSIFFNLGRREGVVRRLHCKARRRDEDQVVEARRHVVLVPKVDGVSEDLKGDEGADDLALAKEEP